MYYIGGKSRQGKKIAAALRPVLGSRPYVEPFCGAMGSASHVVPYTKGEVKLSDASAIMTRLWKHLYETEDMDAELPEYITQDEYQAMRAKKDTGHWMVGYVAHGFSFGGDQWGSYAKDVKGSPDPSYARGHRLKENTLARMETLKRAKGKLTIRQADYTDVVIPEGSVIYCDPPYAGRTNSYSKTNFDTPAFWQWCRDRVAEGHILVASEFNFPDDFAVVVTFGKTNNTINRHTLNTLNSDVEVLVCHESQAHLFNS